jgi:glucose/mannose-6-phosphate isomerase
MLNATNPALHQKGAEAAPGHRKGTGNGNIPWRRCVAVAQRDSDLPSLRDPEGFLPAIQGKASLLQEGHAAGRKAGVAGLQADGLLFAGMGFSGMCANLVKDAATRALDLPFTIVKHYQFPRHVKKGWHVLAISYSGETEETLAVVQAARERGVGVTGFSTGGALSRMVDRVVPQPPGYQPRAAFGYSWFSVLGFLEASGLLKDKVPVAECVEAVREVDASCGPDVPLAGNEAKQLARRIWRPIPKIYATPSFYGVGLHFRGMLNENAKKIADVDLVPESNHNDLTGWGGDTENRRHFAVLCLSHAGQNPQLRKRLTYMEERYRGWGVPWTNLTSDPIETFRGHVVEQARALQFLDYTSVYVAALKGEDPADIREIKALKAHLKQAA